MQRAERADAGDGTARARDVGESLRSLEGPRVGPAALGLSLVYAARAVYAAFSLAGGAADIFALCAATSLFMATLFFLRRVGGLRGLDPRVFIFAMIAAVSADNFYILATRSDIERTAFIMLTLVGAGFLTLSTPLFIVETSLVWAVWGILCAPWFGGAQWARYSLSLLLGTVLAFAIHRVQIKVLTRLETTRLKSESQAASLKAALDGATRSEANYRLLTENSTDLIARISTEGICLYVSPACADLLGYPPEEVIGRRVFDFIHPSDRRSVADVIEPEIFLQSHRKIVCRLKRKNGFFGWYESKLQYFSDMETKEIQIVAIARDIGDRVRAERFETVRHAITTIKASETGIGEEFDFLLKTICVTLQWEMGEIWLVNEESLLLERKSYWCGPSVRLREYAASLSGESFGPGVGLPGTVWSRGTACLLDNVPSAFTSGGKGVYGAAGLSAAIGTVLVDDSRIYGVMLFLSRREIQRNRELLDMIGAAGAELGNFIGRLRARENFRENSEKLGVLARERAVTIRALKSELSRQQRLEQDILMAAEVQKNLLPAGSPLLPGYEFSSAAIPARYISGDFFDFFMPDPSLCDIIIADVSGKGIATAMITSAARTIFRTSRGEKKGPAQVLGEMNEALYPDLERTEMFLTAQLIRLDLGRGRLLYSSAGHTEALHFRASAAECLRLPSTAPPIGVLKKVEIGEMSVMLRPGEFFVIYSDGVTEAVNSEGELFGMERLAGVLERGKDSSAKSLVNAIVSEVGGFSGNKPLVDDLTVIALKALSRKLNLRVPSSMANLDPTVAFVRDAVLPYGDRIAYEMELVASELVTNAITHARQGSGDPPAEGKVGVNGEMDISLSLEADSIAFDLLYPGEPFDVGMADAVLPDPLEEGGRGIPIVRALVDELNYSNDSGMNHWHLVKAAGREKDHEND